MQCNFIGQHVTYGELLYFNNLFEIDNPHAEH